VLYACLSPAARSTDGSIYRTDDVGQTWKRFDHGVKAEATMMGVTAHPHDPNQVYGVSRFGQVFGTQDGGRSWSESRLPEGVRDVYAAACGSTSRQPPEPSVLSLPSPALRERVPTAARRVRAQMADLLSSLEPVQAVDRLSEAAMVLRGFARDDVAELVAA